MIEEIIKFIEEERERNGIQELYILNTAVNTLKTFGIKDIDILINNVENLNEKEIEVLKNLIDKIKVERERTEGLSPRTMKKLIEYVEIENYFIWKYY